MEDEITGAKDRIQKIDASQKIFNLKKFLTQNIQDIQDTKKEKI